MYKSQCKNTHYSSPKIFNIISGIIITYSVIKANHLYKEFPVKQSSLMGNYHRLNTSVDLHYINNNNFRGNKVHKLFKLPFNLVTFILMITIFTLQSESLAQSNLRIFDDIGGGGSSTQTEDSNDNTAIYVVGGLLIAGILVYALVFKKDNKTDTDTTASLNSNLIYSKANDFDSAEELQKVKDKIPVDVFWGIKNNEAIPNDKTYLLGLRIKL
jgi:hypothetical protein